MLSLLGLFARSGPATAENIAIGNYGTSANGMPYAVALAKGYFKEEGADVTGIIASQGGGTSVRNAMAGVAYGEANPGAIAVAIQQGADDQDRQRQRAHHRRVRLDGEEGLPDQDAQGPEGQEDRLHQPALDQPGAGGAAAAEGRLQGRGRGAREDRRLRPDAGRARPRPDRRRRGDRAAVVEGQGQVPRAGHGFRGAAAAGQRRRHGDRRGDQDARRLHPRRHQGAPPRGRVHDRASRRGRRHRGQALQHHARGGAQRGAQPDDELHAGHPLLGQRPDPPRRHEADHRGAARASAR